MRLSVGVRPDTLRCDVGIGGHQAELKRFVAISSGYGWPVNSALDALRARVRQSVAVKTPIHDSEREQIREFLRRFDSLERPFDEHADPVHVTGSAIVVGARGVILVKHKSRGIWLQPGGHIEGGETPWDGALREAHEETGLEVSFADGVPELVNVDVHPGPRGHTHLDLRYL